MLVYPNLSTLTSAAYTANIAFACKPVERTFGGVVPLSLDFRMNRNLTELKQRLTDLLICFIRYMEVLLIHGNFRYTNYLSGSNFVLVENCRHLYLMVLVITSSRYPFFNKVFLINSSSSAGFGLEHIVKARWTKVFIKLILRLGGQNEPHCVYDPVNLGLR